MRIHWINVRRLINELEPNEMKFELRSTKLPKLYNESRSFYRLFFFFLINFRHFFSGKLQASIDQHKAYEKTIRDAKQTVKKNDKEYNREVKKRDAARSDTASLKLKVRFCSIEKQFFEFISFQLAALINERERMQHEIERLNDEFAQARADEKNRDDQRKQELDVLQSSVSKREEKLDKIIKKEREKTTSIDEDERKLNKINVYVGFPMKFLIRFFFFSTDKSIVIRRP